MRSTLIAICLVVTSAIVIQPLSAQRSRSNNPDRLVCRTTVKTGTLAGRERTCLTRAEWERVQEGAQKGARDMVDRLRGSCGHNGGHCPDGT